MSRTASPSMPTERQIAQAFKVVTTLHPNARIARVGPEGVSFEYPDGAKAKSQNWDNRPFSAEVSR